MDWGSQSRRFSQMMAMKLLTQFRASPPMVDLATSVQNIAEAVMEIINAPAISQRFGSC